MGRLFATVEPPAYVDCSPETPVRSVATDSRKIERGDAFIAIAGGTHDGHRFVDQAYVAGARVVIVERGRVDTPVGSHVWVDDTNAVLPELAANAFGRPGDRLRLAGVTGTNGKTTTAHLVGAMLREAGRSFARLGTTGNWLVDHEATAGFTTPFPIELQGLLAGAAQAGATDAVMEVSSHALAQGRARPLRFDAVGFTSFSQDHLDFHADMQAYLAAKCRLARDHLKPGGIAVASVDGHPAAGRFLAIASEIGAQAWRASSGGDRAAELVAVNPIFGAERTEAEIRTPRGTLQLQTPLIGGYNLDNALVAIGLGLGLGLTLPDIAAALASARGAPGRLERVEVPGIAGPTVVVDYAHTPDAVARAIEAVRGICSGRLFVVLGCGGDRDAGKRVQMGMVAARSSDRLWATSDNPRTEDPEVILDHMLAGIPAASMGRVVRNAHRAHAIAQAIAEATPDDLVLIAGKGHEDYQILGTRRIHFDDREHARSALALRKPS